MANEAVGEFFALLDGDEELREELKTEIERAAATAIIQAAAGRGLEFTLEDLEDQITDPVSELSEDELDAVAGGVSMRSRGLSRPSIASVATVGVKAAVGSRDQIPGGKKYNR